MIRSPIRTVPFAFLCALALSSAAAPVTTFQLESMRSRNVFGPFDFSDGARVSLETAVYTLQRGPGLAFSLKAKRSDETFGPFDFEEGRIIVVDGLPFVISGVSAAPKPAGVPAEQESPPETAPAPPVAREPAQPSAPVAPIVRPTAIPPRRTQAPAPVPPPARPFRSASSFFADTSISLYAVIAQQTDYKLDLGSASPGTPLTVDRNAVAVRYRAHDFFFGAGWMASAEWNRDRVMLDDDTEQEIGMDDSSGFFFSVGYDRTLWKRDGWSAGLYAELRHRSESYTVDYAALEERSYVLYTSNNVPVITTELVEFDQTSDVELTETLVYLGGRAGVEAGAWKAYLRALAIALDVNDTSGGIRIDGQPYSFELERENPYVVTLGSAYQVDRFALWGELDLLGETALRLGCTYRF